MGADKPVAESCVRNQDVILDAIRPYVGNLEASVLEIGSGTGQHAVHMASALSNVIWQPSDLDIMLPGIRAWVTDSKLGNVLSPIALDVNDCERSRAFRKKYDMVFTANTIHFVSLETASALVEVAAKFLVEGGLMFVYGAFNETGCYTSDGNRHLDTWLKSRDAASGLKDTSWLKEEALSRSLDCQTQLAMPANNILFVFQKRVKDVR